MAVRRAGATLGVLALLLQCLIVAVHHPAQAAAAWPFQEPGAFCGAIDAGGPALPDDQTAPKTPLHQGVVCPICVSLQAAGPGLLPVLVALVVPVPVAAPAPLFVAATVPPEPFGFLAANPRAPPVPSVRT